MGRKRSNRYRLPDSYRGETIAAFVTLRPNATTTEDELISFCALQLARYKVPQKIKFTPEIPKTAASKIDRKTARAKLIELFGAKG